tara:strand:- start:113 stop:439 length:327 start_codon:yes stop_codon:yes gene_type:complete
LADDAQDRLEVLCAAVVKPLYAITVLFTSVANQLRTIGAMHLRVAAPRTPQNPAISAFVFERPILQFRKVRLTTIGPIDPIISKCTADLSFLDNTLSRFLNESAFASR